MFRGASLVVSLVVLSGVLGSRSYAQQKVVIDKVVAVVGNSIVLYSEVEEHSNQLVEYRRERGYTSDRNSKIEALEQLMEQKLLYNQALIDSVEISLDNIASMADERVGNMAAQAGGVLQLEAQFHRPIYEIKREISSRLEQQQYAQRMRGEITGKVTVTPGEVERFYKKLDKDSLPMVPIQYSYAQITKFPVSTKEAKLRTREMLLGLRERIISGTRFDILARMYSEDGSAAQGGEMDAMPLEQFEAPFAKALEKLKPGQVSEVVETIYGFHIIQLISKTGALYKSRHILVRPVFTDIEMAQTNNVLDSVVVKIREDSITFEAAALEFSDDKYSKFNGGLASNLELLEMTHNMDASLATTKHYKENLPVDDFRALDRLKPEEISTAFQSTDYKGNKLSKVVKLISITPSHSANLKEDYLELELMALTKKQNDTYDEWLDKKIETMFIRIAPEMRIEEAFENKAWLK